MIGAAVCRSRLLSAEGLRERLFTLAFSNLVYPQIWEDPAVDLEALAARRRQPVITIASGGCNVLSYLTAGPAHITAVDINAAHIALSRLKLAAARHLPDCEAFYASSARPTPRPMSRRSSGISCRISMPRPRPIGTAATDCAAAAASAASPAISTAPACWAASSAPAIWWRGCMASIRARC